MTTTVLLTGFGPFPGAPFNPTGPLVKVLAGRAAGTPGVRRRAHVFVTSYEAVDRDLPAVIGGTRPDVLVMFGLAQRSPHLRIETRARNALTAALPDADGRLPAALEIAPGAGASLPLPAPAQRLALAARSTGVPALISQDAGCYLCNYLCWRACEAAAQARAPRLFAFVHVPRVTRATGLRGGLSRPLFAFDDLVRAGEAMVRAAVAAARAGR